jgi:hypothetical protein
MTMDPIRQLRKLLESGLLSRKNAERIARVFYDATKIVYERQKRLNKPELKMKEISSALVLAETLHSQAFRFEAKDALAENFGGEFSEASALEYFDRKVIGQVKDKYGRTIVIDEDAMKSLYKDPVSGKHVVATENYEQVRGKRLPWIRFTLANSEAIYSAEEFVGGSFRRTFLYTAIVSIPLDPKPQVSYYVVPVREGKNNNLRMVTAYSLFQRNKYLSMLSLSRMYVHIKET